MAGYKRTALIKNQIKKYPTKYDLPVAAFGKGRNEGAVKGTWAAKSPSIPHASLHDGKPFAQPPHNMTIHILDDRRVANGISCTFKSGRHRKATMTNTRNTPVILDRLADALGKHDITLKRTHLLEVAAKAFGYKNTHELTADDKAGKNALPEADYLGMVETSTAPLIMLRGPSGGIFAIQADRFFENVGRDANVILSPYGGLLNISNARASANAVSNHVAQTADGHTDPFVTCSNCNWKGKESQCDEIDNISQRICAGETMPAGQCPECGSVAHLTNNVITDEVSEKFAVNPEVPIYLTNACCESVHNDYSFLDYLNIETGIFEGDVYPLTDEEAKYIEEDIMTSDDGLMHALTGYSALYRGKKHIMPTIELPVGPEYDDPSHKEVRKTAEDYASKIMPKVQSMNGNVIIDNEFNNCVVIQILIPFDEIINHKQDWPETLKWIMVDPNLPSVSTEKETRYEGETRAVTVSWIGEGNDGDYDPMTPGDQPLLRFDTQRKNEDGTWEDVDDGSYCTQVPAYAPSYIIEAMPRYLVDQIENGMDNKRGLEMLSWTTQESIEIFLKT